MVPCIVLEILNNGKAILGEALSYKYEDNRNYRIVNVNNLKIWNEKIQKEYNEKLKKSRYSYDWLKFLKENEYR